ncbi:MAG: hypothetical protein ACD_80C00023G0002 [uncultured bacterium (gcode 4)]|uniref:Uncharacterized protein n=1 Tax=uncultured bacterium (gcode 4) TaxID=1234023 RepID=K1XYZ3_9BACT|nr:MAG: hypothetical protein ACD_80C00023G0002 [uncultured bacterium (gcode 4)]
MWTCPACTCRTNTKLEEAWNNIKIGESLTSQWGIITPFLLIISSLNPTWCWYGRWRWLWLGYATQIIKHLFWIILISESRSTLLLSWLGFCIQKRKHNLHWHFCAIVKKRCTLFCLGECFTLSVIEFNSSRHNI